MPEYFMLACFAPPGDDFTNIGVYPRVPGVPSWMTGARFESLIPEPIRLEWDPETAGPRKMLYDSSIPIFHESVLKTLRAAGVDNLDVYRAEILDPSDGSITKEYWAANLIGVIAAADMSQSVYTAHGSPALIDVDFDSLAIDPAKARGAKMFRLAECVSGVAIHESVKRALEAKGGFGLTFLEPADWSG